MALVAVLVGSRSADSSAFAIAEYVVEALDLEGHSSMIVDTKSVDPRALIDCDTTDSSIEDLVGVVDAADALVVCAPVIRNLCTGVTSSLLELLPEAALAHMPAALITTGNGPTNIDLRNHAIYDLVRSLGGQITKEAVHVSAFDVTRHTCAVSLAEEAEEAVLGTLTRLTGEMRAETALEDAGHPQLIDTGRALDRVRQGALLVDVRANPTQGVGLLPGAVHVQKSDLASTFGRHDDTNALVSQSRPIVVVCNTERGSATSVRELRALGYRDLSHVRGGAPALAAALAQSREHSTR